MPDWLLHLFGARQSLTPPSDAEESYARRLLTGDAAPPTDYMRSKKLDEALDKYRQILKRQRKQKAS
jgi:hypothetical protein